MADIPFVAIAAIVKLLPDTLRADSPAAAIPLHCADSMAARLTLEA